MNLRSLFIIIILFFVGFSFHLSANNYNFGDNELMMLPTADTLPKGSIIFSNYELSLFNLTVGISKNVQIGLSGLFPSGGEDDKGGVFLCVKHRIINRKKFKIAAWGSGNTSGFLAGGVASYGTEKTNVHIGMGVFHYKTGRISEVWNSLFFMAGIRQKLTKSIFLIGEYYSRFRYEDLSKGIVSGGCRLKFNKLLFDLGGVYGVIVDNDHIFFPYLKVSLLIK